MIHREDAALMNFVTKNKMKAATHIAHVEQASLLPTKAARYQHGLRVLYNQMQKWKENHQGASMIPKFPLSSKQKFCLS